MKGSAALVAFALLAAALLLYIPLLSWQSDDATLYFLPWLEEFARRGPVAPLGDDVPNYTPPYLYLMALGSLALPVVPPLLILKLISIAGTLFLAAAVGTLVGTFRDRRTALLAGAGTLLLPTVALNGPMWGQVDAIYAGAVVFGVGAALRGKWLLMMAAVGLAVSFKLQTVFLGPFVLYVLVRNRLSPALVLVPPAVYAALLAPAWLAGRPAADLATIYFDQAKFHGRLGMNVPNPWIMIQKLNPDFDTGVAIGIGLAALAGIGLVVLALRARLDRIQLLLLALAAVALMPFILPKMHDRYFFVADVLSYALAVCTPRPRTIVTALLIQVGSLGAYFNYLFQVPRGAVAGSVFMTIGIVLLVSQLAVAFRSRPDRPVVA